MSDIRSRIDKAVELKLLGNELFKQQQYKKAIVKYSTGIAYVKCLPGSKRGLSGMAEMAASQAHTSGITATTEEDQEAGEIEALLLLNIGTSQIKLLLAAKAIENIDKSIAINGQNWKSYFRKSEALLLRNDCDAARVCLSQAQRLTDDPAAMKAIHADMKKIQAKEKDQKQKQKDAFAGIFRQPQVNSAAASSQQPASATS